MTETNLTDKFRPRQAVVVLVGLVVRKNENGGINV